ncbi:MAG: PqiC family protein [Magnetospirillum sp.]|nr:PqiC family protein [Magnetospirillum sp.]
MNSARWVVLASFAAACSQLPPPREYIMRPLAGNATSPMAGQGLAVVVAPTRLPDYLDRAGLPTLAGGSEIMFSDGERWADRPSDDISRVVAANIQTLLPAAVVTAQPLPAAAQGRQVMLVLDIADMVLDRDGVAVLKGRWSILDGAGNTLLRTGMVDYSERVAGGQDRQDQLAAMDRNLLRLGQDVARALSSLPRGQGS